MKKSWKMLLAAGSGLAAIAAANSAIFARAKALGNTLGGDGRFWAGTHGDCFYTSQGKGQRVVLLHGIYAGASNYEWRKNFDTLSEHFHVTAPEWLGFGLSDKPSIKYNANLYIEQLKQFLQEVIQEPCTLVASSLAAAYAIQVAFDRPDLVSQIILIAPTGFDELNHENELKAEVIYQTLHSPVLGTTAYNFIASQASLRWYLMNQVYFDPSYVDDAMIDHYSTVAHQYGAQNAPPAFISGLLNHDVSHAFANLPQNTIRLVWGREERISPLSHAEPFLAANSKAVLIVIDKCGALPQDEQAQTFNRLVIESVNLNEVPHKKTRVRKAVSETQKEGEIDGSTE